MVKGELTFNDYLEKKFFVGNNFKCYKYDEGDFSKIEHSHIEEGFIEVVDFVEVSDSTNEGILTEVKGKITKDTFQKINTHIKENFFIEVEKQFIEIKTKFEKTLSTHYDKPYLIEAETNTIKQILRGQKNSIVDTFRVTHIVIKYVSGMPIVQSELLKLSPAFNIDTTTLSDIRKYMVNEYGLKLSNLYFIKNPLFANKYKSYVMAEVFIKYLDFLRKLASQPSNNKEQATPKNDSISQDKMQRIIQKPESKIVDVFSFDKKNYKTAIVNWNKNNDDKLTKWLQSGKMVEIQKWLFVSSFVLSQMNNKLNEYYQLIDLNIIRLNNLQSEIKETCNIRAQQIKQKIISFFATNEDPVVMWPLGFLCSRIIEQPYYLLEALENYPDDLPESKKIWWRHAFLLSRFGLSRDKYKEMSSALAETVRVEISNGSKEIVTKIFLFMDQFIDDLKTDGLTHFQYFKSPLFKTLFTDIIVFRNYYEEAFGHFNFSKILEIEDEFNSNKSDELPVFNPDDKFKCKCDTLRRDISELCEDCPILFHLQEDVEQQIIIPARDMQIILSKQDFERYVQNEIDNAVNAMKIADMYELQNKDELNEPHRHDRTSLYIWNKERIKALSRLINEGKTLNLSSFRSSIHPDDIPLICMKLKDKKFIEADKKCENFKLIFSNKSIPADFEKVKWILESGPGSPHKSALRELLSLLIDGKPTQKIIDHCFSDAYGNAIKLSKSKVKEFSNYYIDLEKLVKSFRSL